MSRDCQDVGCSTPRPGPWQRGWEESTQCQGDRGWWGSQQTSGRSLGAARSRSWLGPDHSTASRHQKHRLRGTPTIQPPPTPRRRPGSPRGPQEASAASFLLADQARSCDQSCQQKRENKRPLKHPPSPTAQGTLGKSLWEQGACRKDQRRDRGAGASIKPDTPSLPFTQGLPPLASVEATCPLPRAQSKQARLSPVVREGK